MLILAATQFWLICCTICCHGHGLYSPFESGEVSYPSPSSFLFPNAFGTRSSFVFPRSIFARRISIKSGGNKSVNEISQSKKTCPEGSELRRDANGANFICECKKYHLKWKEDGLCYREYEQGPCPHGHR